VEQWENEIRRNATEARFEYVRVFRSSHKELVSQVAKYDIIITSYWELAESCPWFSKKEIEYLKKKGREEDANPEDDDPCYIEEAIEEKLLQNEGGTLHQINFHRVSSTLSYIDGQS
jgi:hypothetical protein